MSRRVYSADLTVNGKRLNQIVIDPHYEEKHAKSVDDETIVALVGLLNGKTFVPIDVDDEGFEYFMNDRMEIKGKFFKLIWLLQENELFVGVVNAYRR